MTDTYSVVPGWNDPSLPPVNLPSMDLPPSPRAPVRITVGRTPPPPEKPVAGRPAETPPTPARPAWEDLPDVETAPRKEEKPAAAKPAWEDLPDIADVPPPKKPGPVIGTGEAAGIGALQELTFGAQPVIAGLTEAAGEPGKRAMEQEQRMLEENPYAGEMAGYAGVAQPFIGAARMVYDWIKGHPDPSVQESYERGRQAALERRDAAYEQHKFAYMGGMMAGSLLTPGFGVGAPARAAGRIYQGIRAGGIGGGLTGIGTGISEGKTAEQIARDVPFETLMGGVTGAGGQYVFGPRARGGPGQRAAETAAEVGGGLPVGYASERPWVHHTTGAMEGVPFVGPRISSKVERTGERAGERVEQVVGETGMPILPTGQPGRAATATRVSHGLEAAVQRGEQVIDSLYNNVRGRIDPGRELPMPRLQATLNRLEYERINAGWTNPGLGFEQYRRLAQRGASFNGAQRARSEARKAGKMAQPHPGFDAGDYRAIVRAMTADMQANVRAAAHNTTPAGQDAALRAFQEAERHFGPISELNEQLARLAREGQGGLEAILTAAGEKGGDLPLLEHLRRSMPQAEFRMLGGQLVAELGQSATGFNLSQFANNWRKLGDQAKRVLLDPAHREQLDRIAEMGDWLREARRYAPKIHGSNNLAYMLAAGELLTLSGEAYGMYQEMEGGGPGAYTALTTAQSLGTIGGAFILGNRARTAAATNWLQAVRGLMAQTTPARTAAFNVATRNFANTVGIPERTLLQMWNDLAKKRMAGEAPPEEGPTRKSEARVPAGT